ncbi:caspase domain-containing protein [Streptomyces sp. NPDC048018]|uniref:caspase family protein n=1 Tax=Streptomyces sp. NPDC048018 TaxID=3365499 RepID=UPI00371D090D
MADRERQALIVVTSAYDDPGLGALRAPSDDAEALAEVLRDPDVGGFEVEVVTDPSSQKLRVKVEDFFADRSPRHTLLLHFSCHGVKNSAGKLFLATTDTRRSRLASTSVPAEYVSSLMLESRAQRVVVLLDCCYAGAFERGMFARAGTDAHVQASFQELERTGGRRGRAVFTASSAVEYAFEEGHPVTEAGPASGRRPSLFTGSLVEGLRSGDADRDGDGEVGMAELADYVHDRLSELTPHQTPQLWLFGAHGGDVPIARTRPRAPTAAALPTELDEAVHEGRRGDRLWAVEDLGHLLCGEDVGLALSAREALLTLAGDDSRRVSVSAEQALAAARPRVACESLDLGTVTAGAPGLRTLLVVEGPPIVHATIEATPVEPWLTATAAPDGVQLSAVVSTPGHYEGDVLVKAATGEVPVHVGLEALPVRRRKQEWPVWEPTARQASPPGPEPVREEPPRETVRRPVPRVREEPPAAEQRREAPTRVAKLRLWLAQRPEAGILSAAVILLFFALGAPLLHNGKTSYWGDEWPVSWASNLIVLGLISTGTFAVVAMARPAFPLGRTAFAWLACTTATTLATLGSVLDVLFNYDYLELSAGTVLLILGCLLQLSACVTSWRRRRRRPMTAPPRPG